MMRTTGWIAAVVLLLSTFAVPDAGAAEKRGRSQFRQYVKKTYSPKAAGRSAIKAGFSHLRNKPREWGGGLAGYGKRFASSFGHHVVKASIETGVAAWRKENNQYVPSGKKGVWGRIGYATVNTFVARKPTGRRTFSTSRVAGAMGGGMISRLWHPARYHTVASGLTTGGISLGSNVGVNIAREFLSKKKSRAAE